MCRHREGSKIQNFLDVFFKRSLIVIKFSIPTNGPNPMLHLNPQIHYFPEPLNHPNTSPHHSHTTNLAAQLFPSNLSVFYFSPRNNFLWKIMLKKVSQIMKIFLFVFQFVKNKKKLFLTTLSHSGLVYSMSDIFSP